MNEPSPFDLTDQERRRSRRMRLLVIAVLLVVIGVPAVVVYLRWKDSQKTASVAPSLESDAGTQAAAPTPPAADVTQGETLLRELASKLSSSPELAKWLAESGILRRLVAAVNLVAEGSSPRPVVGFLAPSGGFAVVKENRHLYPSPRSYARYDFITRVLGSIDPVAAANAYGQLKPFFDAAFTEVGRPGKSFDAVLRDAIKNLTSTPVPQTDPELQEKGLVYVYVDPTLEQLTQAQKHLLRTGPKNARAIQDWLSKFMKALPQG
jgi:hypothetical protein